VTTVGGETPPTVSPGVSLSPTNNLLLSSLWSLTVTTFTVAVQPTSMFGPTLRPTHLCMYCPYCPYCTAAVQLLYSYCTATVQLLYSYRTATVQLLPSLVFHGSSCTVVSASESTFDYFPIVDSFGRFHKLVDS
jgi:hypothetical protein